MSYDAVGLQSGVVYIYPWTTRRSPFSSRIASPSVQRRGDGLPRKRGGGVVGPFRDGDADVDDNDGHSAWELFT